MIKKNSSKEETLRIRVFAFFNENRSLGKIFTVRHFMAEKIPRSTVYRILKRSDYFSPERKQGCGPIPKKVTVLICYNNFTRTYANHQNLIIEKPIFCFCLSTTEILLFGITIIKREGTNKINMHSLYTQNK
ncbi:tripeptidyl-peptidase 2 [Brachionus plicatilis]|uniref:Tripeptidyl-peptidase 2 n=1 Tax=Brachionus plicatilis TaxID=10195 RepID=A0A3M7P0P0_BRAPC|nr:tripeptidyl-peptidase 2 [Brachionus plicatilis]